jgi:hypothetical protein
MHIIFMKGRNESTYPWSRDYMYRDWRVKSEAEINFFRFTAKPPGFAQT